ncbi:MAG: PEP-CTERM sorting domain-containing protein [Cyanobacteriota bacterium]|nr:PEP-CTERM sorting domain-containing protein [Cyanobacteriota bacterium]
MTVSSILKTLSVATVAMTATISAIAPAQALNLNGSIGLSGDAGIPAGDDLPSLSISFSDIMVENPSGDFAGVTSATVSDLDLTLVQANTFSAVLGSDIDLYTSNDVDDFIDFGTQTINGETGTLTFDLNGGGFFRLAPSGTFSLTAGGISGNFEFNGDTFAQGFLSASRAGSADTFELTLSTEVPEPFTILGSLSALGVGAVMKKQHEKRQNKA